MELQGFWPIGNIQKQAKTRLQVKTVSENSPPVLFIMWVTMEMGGMVLKETGKNNTKLWHIKSLFTYLSLSQAETEYCLILLHGEHNFTQW